MYRIIVGLVLLGVLDSSLAVDLEKCDLLYGWEGHKVYSCKREKTICNVEGNCKKVGKLEVYDADKFVFVATKND